MFCFSGTEGHKKKQAERTKEARLFIFNESELLRVVRKIAVVSVTICRGGCLYARETWPARLFYSRLPEARFISSLGNFELSGVTALCGK